MSLHNDPKVLSALRDKITHILRVCWSLVTGVTQHLVPYHLYDTRDSLCCLEILVFRGSSLRMPGVLDDDVFAAILCCEPTCRSPTTNTGAREDRLQNLQGIADARNGRVFREWRNADLSRDLLPTFYLPFDRCIKPQNGLISRCETKNESNKGVGIVVVVDKRRDIRSSGIKLHNPDPLLSDEQAARKLSIALVLIYLSGKHSQTQQWLTVLAGDMNSLAVPSQLSNLLDD